MTYLFKHILLLFFLSLQSYSIFAQKTVFQYLSGTDKDHTVLWDFKCSSGRNSGKWTTIPVPSNWELQGFGTFNYGWEKNDGEDGFYKHTFQSVPSFKNKRVQLVFEGSMTDTEVRINGKVAGPIHQGAFYRFKYDITKLLKAEGENLLEVTVRKVSSDTSVNRAERMSDYWVFGGIYRPVYLEVLPKQFIDWTAVDAKADGSFLMEVHPADVTDATKIEAQIFSMDGKAVGVPFSKAFKKGESKVTISTKIDNPLIWSPEFPNRYQVSVRLMNAKGAVHTITEKFGFRTVEFKEGVGFFVNGAKIMFKGANRHSFWPKSGRTTSKEINVMDVTLMKDMNMNAVRMSHYPPDVDFLDACDSLGLFVLDELGGWQKKYDTPVGKKLVREMMMKDVNHPSIVIWDNGNEGGNNFDLDDEFAKYDPQKRQVIHPWNIFRGIDTQHYRGYDCCAGSFYNGNEVFFPTEFLHGLYDGGNGSGLEDHWKLMLSKPLSAGLFLWAFADEGIVRGDRNDSIDVKGNLAPDGIVGPYREKEGSFYTIKEIWSPVQIGMEKILNDFDGRFPVKNYYFYTNLNVVTFSWRLSKMSSPSPSSGDDQASEIILEKSEFKGPDLAPQEQGVLNLNLPADYRKADVLFLKATDQYGRELYTWSWPLKLPQEITKALLQKDVKDQVNAAFGRVKVRNKEDLLLVSANNVEIGLSNTTGLLFSVISSGSKISFSNGPVLAVGKTTFKSLKHYREGENQVVEVMFSGDMKRLKYTMQPSGILQMDYAYSADSRKEHDFLGINFNYPEDQITGVQYLGRGPYRVWKNRMKGGSFNVWHKKYNNTVTGQSWDYPEFKGYYKDLNWVVIENKEHLFKIFTDTPDLFLRLYTPEKPKAAGNDNTSPAFPNGDISFLHGINSIGTKFDGAESHGPQGGKNKVGNSWVEGRLYFDFR
ncbi:glycoside hydrolase family 2 protein [Arcticibacter eurypsychrophilus]|uniref:glycoside hydrolase family 2 protein n=1 Tax=Arcticibacter eurypsychrophilus TaxID=1434752 RepID=UPI00084D384A|nr:glycoside hydrolase family 2 [Arcticibacter eurypsychrophilus]